MTIRSRLALLFTVAACVLLLGGGALFVTRLESGLESSLTQSLIDSADSIAARVGTTGAPEAVAESARYSIRGALRGTYAQLLTTGGTVLATSRGLPDDPILTTAQFRSAATRDVVFDTSMPLDIGGDAGTEAVRVLARRLGRSDVVVAVAVSRDVVDRAVASSRNQLLLLGLGVLLLAGPGSWLLTRAALRPVERMRLEVGNLHANSPDTTLQVPDTHDEIARLAQTFNGLLARLNGALFRERELVADAGHELRTPLTVLQGELELARRPNRTRDELAETVDVAAEVTDQLVRLTDDLLFLSADPHADLSKTGFEVGAVVRHAVQGAERIAAIRAVTIVVACPSSVRSVGNPDWISRAVFNVVINAVRHAPDRTVVSVAVARAGSDVQVTISDAGPGFPPDFLPRAFERFTRADGARERADSEPADSGGSGLGLAIVRSIMLRHGGQASAANRPGGGAEVVLTWPAT